jgi:hypothetical protein
MPKVRIAQSFDRMTDAQLVGAAGAVIEGLTDNKALPNPSVDLKTLADTRDQFSAAIALRPHGGPGTAHKNNKRGEFIALMFRLAHYVQDNCSGAAPQPVRRPRPSHRQSEVLRSSHGPRLAKTAQPVRGSARDFSLTRARSRSRVLSH